MSRQAYARLLQQATAAQHSVVHYSTCCVLTAAAAMYIVQVVTSSVSPGAVHPWVSLGQCIPDYNGS